MREAAELYLVSKELAVLVVNLFSKKEQPGHQERHDVQSVNVRILGHPAKVSAYPFADGSWTRVFHGLFTLLRKKHSHPAQFQLLGARYHPRHNMKDRSSQQANM